MNGGTGNTPKKGQKIVFKYGLPKNAEEISLGEFSCTYLQEADSCAPGSGHDLQELIVSTQDAGAGVYYILKTDRWAINDIDEMIKVLQDFKARFL